MRTRSWLIAFAVFWLSGPVHAELVLGVHPFKPATRLVEAFTPMTRYLSDKLGQPVALRISQDYRAHIEATGKNAYDIAYLGPSLYVKVRDAHGERPLLARQRIGDKPVFHSKIFVRADSPVKDLAGLEGKRFAFGDPKSTMGHLVPRYLLWQSGHYGRPPGRPPLCRRSRQYCAWRAGRRIRCRRGQGRRVLSV